MKDLLFEAKKLGLDLDYSSLAQTSKAKAAAPKGTASPTPGPARPSPAGLCTSHAVARLSAEREVHWMELTGKIILSGAARAGRTMRVCLCGRCMPRMPT